MSTTLPDLGKYLDDLTKDASSRIKLEITGGTQTWRLLPSLRHQKVIDRIRASITPHPDTENGCGCYHVSDAYLRFPDGSLKRPDIAIFCTEPPDLDEAWEQVPEAVIEIVSPDYEEKDLSINPPWYLSQGVRDVVIFEPRLGTVVHHRHQYPTTQTTAPVVIDLQCGCHCTL
ncbi:MAG: Uma2 family endonuclease [Chloroflexi bacterium AL-W]|nr:Uma2 family endonuclease [Chloroflexi bacterium AL-N1]NOK64794.1 Uma2 family endonuclease [Chloroflexi bacterium AL-N10]NOK76564.1 Uma2 family endonuclease [Chloroflexi bacterium AL-N5]NOK80206.1 Uma2 family endonuclease [Chloroflexi bacterium AL-W]NOK86719.1 Uma2 family endonuclease [Chloroflexi bacterium AL-N15]